MTLFLSRPTILRSDKSHALTSLGRQTVPRHPQPSDLRPGIESRCQVWKNSVDVPDTPRRSPSMQIHAAAEPRQCAAWCWAADVPTCYHDTESSGIRILTCSPTTSSRRAGCMKYSPVEKLGSRLPAAQAGRVQVWTRRRRFGSRKMSATTVSSSSPPSAFTSLAIR